MALSLYQSINQVQKISILYAYNFLKKNDLEKGKALKWENFSSPLCLEALTTANLVYL